MVSQVGIELLWQLKKLQVDVQAHLLAVEYGMWIYVNGDILHVSICRYPMAILMQKMLRFIN